MELKVDNVRFCLNCGKEIKQDPKRKTKKFCSDYCRSHMWHKQKKQMSETEPVPENAHVCFECGKIFFVYSQKNRKYCSRECYISARFRNEKVYSRESNPAFKTLGPLRAAEITEKHISQDDVECYIGNPYIKNTSLSSIEPNTAFYKAGYSLIDAGIDDILTAFEMKPENFSVQEKQMFIGLMERMGQSPESEQIPEVIEDVRMRIMINRNRLMGKLVEARLRDIGNHIKAMSKGERKEICKVIKSLPKDPGGVLTVGRMIELCGISRNSYYCYIRYERYGLSIELRDALDEPDVRAAFEYKGYKKGVRMVYMLIPILTGRKIGIDRVRRIMRRYGMESGVRSANDSRRAAQKRLAEYRKPNILRRMFRLHRPNKVRITDVTILEYGRKKAYGSALMDPVTGVLIAFVVSEQNNLELAMETLHRSDRHRCRDGGIFHSDQGSVYLSPEFQEEVKKLGFEQSMSKRGNCWDNAPQESFFGHFKDECDYSGCKSIEELRAVIDGYLYYYNNERGLWDREHMTPLQYENYLLSLTDDEFAEYMDREEKKYKDMQKRSAKKAKDRYKTLGV